MKKTIATILILLFSTCSVYADNVMTAAMIGAIISSCSQKEKNNTYALIGKKYVIVMLDPSGSWWTCYYVSRKNGSFYCLEAKDKQSRETLKEIFLDVFGYETNQEAK